LDLRPSRIDLPVKEPELRAAHWIAFFIDHMYAQAGRRGKREENVRGIEQRPGDNARRIGAILLECSLLAAQLRQETIFTWRHARESEAVIFGGNDRRLLIRMVVPRDRYPHVAQWPIGAVLNHD
jgi:hypothetical protein